MAEAIVSQVISQLGATGLEKGFEKAIEKGKQLLSVREEALKLKEKLETLRAFLADAEKKEFQDGLVKLWVDRLKDVAYDIEDVFDDWTTAETNMPADCDDSDTSSQPWEKVCLSLNPMTYMGNMMKPFNIGNRIVEIHNRLDVIAKDKCQFNLEVSSQSESRPVTTSFENINNNFHIVASQENAKKELIQMLLHDEEINNLACVPVISIVGVGGIGKTTLARMVYNDAEIVGVQKIWVCVSDKFDKIKVAKSIGEALHLRVQKLVELQNILTEIRGAIEGKQFFLVLDDVWTEERQENWDDIMGCLGVGSRGSRILVTTRSRLVSDAMNSSFKYEVGILTDEDSWLLFSHSAFCRKTERERRKLEGIARKIVKSCNGLPLALDVFGKFMAGKKSEEWKEIIKSNLWELKLEGSVFRSLIFSYFDLPLPIRRCFAMCSLFPKDTKMSKTELIGLWMAHGLLGKNNGSMEVVGGEYFNHLAARSFFQSVESSFQSVGSGRDETVVKMHDIIHDFAQYISRKEIAHLESYSEIEKELPCGMRPRHLLLSKGFGESSINHLVNILDLKSLRTLFLSIKSTTIFKNISSEMLHLRALTINLIHIRISGVEFEEAIRAMKKLIHLRYLKLRSSVLEVLPEELCDLHYLQTLDLEDCHAIKMLPKGIGRMSSLRHLIFSLPCKLDNFPNGIGKLKELRTLKDFFLIRSVMDGCDNCCLKELGKLENLRGVLGIQYLNQVVSASEAAMAKLHEKEDIHSLTLGFGEGDAQKQLEIIEGLRPACEDLDHLQIEDYEGRFCPKWIADLSYVKEIELIGVEIVQFPPLGLLSFLETLRVRGASEIMSVGDEFYGTRKLQNDVVKVFLKLKTLDLERLSRWAQWDDPSVNHAIMMPSLRRLRICNCPLRALPCFFEALLLVDLVVKNCPYLEVTIAGNDDDKKLSIGGVMLPQTLEYIEVNDLTLRDHLQGVLGPYDDFKQPRHYLCQPDASSNKPVQRTHVTLKYMCIGALYSQMQLSRIPDWITMHLVNLVSIRMFGGHKVDWLPPFGLLPWLVELKVSAGKIIMLGDEFLGIYSNNNKRACSSSHFVPFRNLTHLRFDDMFVWEEWGGGGNTHCQEVKMIMPRLRYLCFTGCRELKSIPHFLEYVQLESLEMIGATPPIRNSEDHHHVTDGEKANIEDNILGKSLKNLFVSLGDFGIYTERYLAWRKYFTNLREVHLSIKGSRLPTVMAELPLLKILHVRLCYHIKKIGKELVWSDNEQLNDMMIKLGDESHIQNQSHDVQTYSSSSEINFTAFPNLEQLHFNHMYMWEDWEDHVEELKGLVSAHMRDRGNNNNIAVNISIMPKLRVLNFNECPNLKALPKFLHKVHLQELKIGRSAYLKFWYESVDEVGGDWASWKSNIETTTISDEYHGWSSADEVRDAVSRPNFL